MHILNRRDLGNQLQVWRKIKGLSLIDVEKSLRINRRFISMWEQGLKYPSQEDLDKLCEFYGKE